MVRKCCVPGCSSNYEKENSYTTVFSFPKDPMMHNKWRDSIHRKDFIPGSQAVVCIKHFDDQMIIREDRFKQPDGTEIVIPRTKLKLAEGAYPTIFSGQPAYLSKSLPQKRKAPEERREEGLQRDEAEFQKFLEDDKIKDYDDFKSNIKNRIFDPWICSITDECTVIYKMNFSKAPKCEVSFKVFSDLTVQAFTCDSPFTSTKYIDYILEKKLLNNWTKLDCILSRMASFEIKSLSLNEQVSCAVEILKYCLNEVTDEKLYVNISFLMEQLSLITSKQLRYSPNMLFWACKLYYTYPAAYSLISDSNVIKLPNQSYLRKLSTSLSYDSNLSSVNQVLSYLKKKAELLDDHEKVVALLLDEIYITPSVSYKSGNIVGVSENVSNEEASTVQTFMISSIFSKNKDVLALIPVKNLTAEQLHAYTLKVLQILHEYGYTVLALISDNNRINRKMFELMCGGEIKPCINNPFNCNQMLFFLFDTCHLIKCIRNNWLNSLLTNQTFFYSDINDASQVSIASLLHLKKIYDLEKNSIIKQAPKLNRKVLFPTTTERQNVNHALNLFHESNLVALQIHSVKFGKDFIKTKSFISHILTWWNVVNCKHPLKGKHLRNTACDPITSKNHQNLFFLQNFLTWLRNWQKLSELSKQEKKSISLPEKGGMLSKETFFSLIHTTEAMIALSNYMFDTLQCKYVLLGKFQTDSLEARFGQYRQMSGGNYCIALRQILESEKKLKVLDLIKLKSKTSGDISIKLLSVDDSLDNISSVNDVFNDDADVCDISDFQDIVFSAKEFDIAENIMSVLIYIAGYVAFKVKNNMACSDCISKITAGKAMEFECSETVAEYLKFSSRGGLQWPKNFTVDIIVQAFGVFQFLISEHFENRFLSHGKQKSLLSNLTKARIDFQNVLPVSVCHCGVSSDTVSMKCLSVISNILLNNYCKVRNNKIAEVKEKKKIERKLKTLKKS